MNIIASLSGESLRPLSFVLASLPNSVELPSLCNTHSVHWHICHETWMIISTFYNIPLDTMCTRPASSHCQQPIGIIASDIPGSTWLSHCRSMSKYPELKTVGYDGLRNQVCDSIEIKRISRKSILVKLERFLDNLCVFELPKACQYNSGRFGNALERFKKFQNISELCLQSFVAYINLETGLRTERATGSRVFECFEIWSLGKAKNSTVYRGYPNSFELKSS